MCFRSEMLARSTHTHTNSYCWHKLKNKQHCGYTGSFPCSYFPKKGCWTKGFITALCLRNFIPRVTIYLCTDCGIFTGWSSYFSMQISMTEFKRGLSYTKTCLRGSAFYPIWNILLFAIKGPCISRAENAIQICQGERVPEEMISLLCMFISDISRQRSFKCVFVEFFSSHACHWQMNRKID